MDVFGAVVFMFLQATTPPPQRVVLAFALDPAHEGLPIVVQTYQGNQFCENVRTLGNERQCDVMVVRPNMLRLSTIRKDGLFGQWSNFTEIPEAGNGSGLPGVVRITFAGVMP